MGDHRPVLVVNPSGDLLFASFAELLLDHGVTTPAQLEMRLRREYPAAVVHARVLSDEPITIWYAYRDGRWVSDDNWRTGDGRYTGRPAGNQRVAASGRGAS